VTGCGKVCNEITIGCRDKGVSAKLLARFRFRSIGEGVNRCCRRRRSNRTASRKGTAARAVPELPDDLSRDGVNDRFTVKLAARLRL